MEVGPRTVKLIDRKKNIFKLAQGEFVAPSKIEAILMKSKFIRNIFVHGTSEHDFLVGKRTYFLF